MDVHVQDLTAVGSGSMHDDDLEDMLADFDEEIWLPETSADATVSDTSLLCPGLKQDPCNHSVNFSAPLAPPLGLGTGGLAPARASTSSSTGAGAGGGVGGITGHGVALGVCEGLQGSGGLGEHMHGVLEDTRNAARSAQPAAARRSGAAACRSTAQRCRCGAGRWQELRSPG